MLVKTLWNVSGVLSSRPWRSSGALRIKLFIIPNLRHNDRKQSSNISAIFMYTQIPAALATSLQVGV